MPPAVDPDSSNTVGNPEHPNIPPDLPPNFRHWNRGHVKMYLEDNKDAYGLDQADIDLIYESKIRGRHFRKMTVEMLVKDCQLPPGVSRNSSPSWSIVKDRVAGLAEQGKGQAREVGQGKHEQAGTSGASRSERSKRERGVGGLGRNQSLRRQETWAQPESRGAGDLGETRA
ncbi:hypothetical protein BGX38DRAFT_102911 [Terfezia claveryi]|nr:hypothetical protein BGX38DRAFT_102911 [Terfezia claveryi]